jgi:hypothetical protein
MFSYDFRQISTLEPNLVMKFVKFSETILGNPVNNVE